MPGFIYQAFVSGLSNHWYWAAHPIIGKMNPAFLAGKRVVSTNGMREDLKPLYGSLINLLKINSTAP